MVGTIYADKGHADALELLVELRQRGIEAGLEVVGEGREMFVRELKELASTLGVSKRVVWSGFQKDPLPPLRHAHICLVCSRREAFGRVAVEAMSVGTPVVATAVGGLTEIIRDGETGLLYKPGEVDRLADAVESLVENHARYCPLALSGMRHVHSHFTVDLYRQKMIAAFEMVIGGQKL